MDHSRSVLVVALVGALLALAGCSSTSSPVLPGADDAPLPSQTRVTPPGAGATASAVPTPDPTPDSTSTSSPTPSSPPPSGPSPSTGAPGSALEAEGPGPLGSQVLLPEDPVGAPVAVLVHGGAWVAGTPDSMAPLARALTDFGLVTVNLSYSTLALGGREPRLTDDVACGIRHAMAVADEVGADGPMVLVGHSAGAHLATVVALSPDGRAATCPWPGDVRPDRLVALAGVFTIDAVEVVMRALLGGRRSEVPDAWEAFDPVALVAASAPGVGRFPVDLLVGSEDRLAPPSESRRLANALEVEEADVQLVELAGRDHFTIIAPAVADAILEVLG